MEQLKLDAPSKMPKIGIYKINYAQYFYVGRSIMIKQRVKAHKYELEKLLLQSNIPDHHYLLKVVQFLKSNPLVRTLKVSVLEVCQDSHLMEAEQHWLTEYENDPHCLNVGFISKPSSADTVKANFKPVDIELKDTMQTQNELNLYNEFLNNLNQLRTIGKIKSKFPY